MNASDSLILPRSSIDRYDALAAVVNGDLDGLRRLIKAGSVTANDVSVDGTTPLLVYAACFGRANIVDELIHRKADVHAKDEHGWTALAWAVAHENFAIARILVNAGATLDVKFENVDLSDLLFIKSDTTLASMLREQMADKAFQSKACDQPGGFLWRRCRPKELLVCTEASIPNLIYRVITRSRPSTHPERLSLPASALFLAIRYASRSHHPALLEMLFFGTIEAVRHELGTSIKRTHEAAYWLSNMTRLWYFLQKDECPQPSTKAFWPGLVQLIEDLFRRLQTCCETKLTPLIKPCIVLYQPEMGSDVAKLTLLARTRLSLTQPFRFASDKRSILDALACLDSLLTTTVEYGITSDMADQVFDYLAEWLNVQIFNEILLCSELNEQQCGIHLRYNVFRLEEWWSHRKLKGKVHFKKSIQLASLMQVFRGQPEVELLGLFEELHSNQVAAIANRFRDKGETSSRQTSSKRRIFNTPEILGLLPSEFVQTITLRTLESGMAVADPIAIPERILRQL